MKRYIFSYSVKSTNLKSEFGVVAYSEEEAFTMARSRIADIEFTNESDIVVHELIRVVDDNDNYFECESCT